MLDILIDITKGKGSPDDIGLLIELSEAIKTGSICGLGKTAPNPILTTLRYFRDEYEAHIKYKRCHAAVCKEIISSPCQHVCPIDTEAPAYISYIAHGRFKDAFKMIRKDNPLLSVCARVCHHPCESKCQAGKWGDPIAIRALKRFAADYALKTGIYKATKKNKKGKGKIAVVGSGPAGLMAGHSLANKGYSVTIFEALDVIGGALAVYIPEYRLPKKILNADIENIKNSGVEIKTNTKVGKDITLRELLKNYKAVFIATGAHKSRRLNITNEDADGVIDAMEFLKEVNCKKEVKIDNIVGVIGGGNAAVDAARVAARLKGCKKVFIIYRRTRKEMPAFEEEVEAAIGEGIEIQYLTAPVRIITKGKKLTGIECARMKLGDIDESGRRRPVTIPDSEFVIGLDNLIVAVGEEPDTLFIGDTQGVEVSKRGRIVVSEETFATGLKGVFAGGDVVTGPSTVIDAMSSGKIAAEMIDKYIRGKEIVREYSLTRPSVYVSPVKLRDDEIEESKRPKAQCLSIKRRVNNFNEVELNMTRDLAIKEARRCLRCDLETEDAKIALENKPKKKKAKKHG